MTDVVTAARGIAADLLAPAAAAVEAAGTVPRSSLDRLADAGLYGLTGPVDAGGAAADAATVAAVVEELAAGDLATTFVWLQHLGVVGRLATSGSPQLRSTFLADLCAGRLRAGIALQAAVRPGPPAIRARRDGAELVLDGAVPWVTGWGWSTCSSWPPGTGTTWRSYSSTRRAARRWAPRRSRWSPWRPAGPSSCG